MECPAAASVGTQVVVRPAALWVLAVRQSGMAGEATPSELAKGAVRFNARRLARADRSVTVTGLTVVRLSRIIGGTAATVPLIRGSRITGLPSTVVAAGLALGIPSQAGTA